MIARAAAENWRAIPGFEGIYEASDYGRVRSLSRIVTCKTGVRKRLQGRVLAQNLNEHGYFTTAFAGARALVHRLFAAAFLPPDPDRPHVNHLSGVKTFNRPENLAWCTIKENNAHAKEIGLGSYTPPHIFGARHYAAKLTDESVRAARIRHGNGTSIRTLARLHGVDKSTMKAALSGGTWSHVT